jgi:hypothetical protein
MNAIKLYQSMSKIVSNYKSILANMGEEGFSATPPIGGWSFSEVYSHIFDSSLLSLMALHKAAKGGGEDKTTHFTVKLILLFGTLPPGRKYKVPNQLMNRVKKINLKEAENFIADFELQLEKIFPHLEHANPKMKVKHPRLGYLNAKQWLRFIEIHLNHHFKQIKRIEKSFRQQ